jgi:hypothetical protein
MRGCGQAAYSHTAPSIVLMWIWTITGAYSLVALQWAIGREEAINSAKCEAWQERAEHEAHDVVWHEQGLSP